MESKMRASNYVCVTDRVSTVELRRLTKVADPVARMSPPLTPHTM